MKKNTCFPCKGTGDADQTGSSGLRCSLCKGSGKIPPKILAKLEPGETVRLMKEGEHLRFNAGTILIIRYGTTGTQRAGVSGYHTGGRVTVRKWSTNSRMWTKTVRPLDSRDIIGVVIPCQ